ncbi:MAG TPA: tagaturonate epimerase family protein [Polyangiaceae bacterium]|nr:tagaturonate epimerase family protein [Polyangiaceae bacterium]
MAMNIETNSIGIGDRFGKEGLAQLRAIRRAEEEGILVVPVWNKSNREHSLIGTTPADVRSAADAAVREAGWTHRYYVDADHIGLKTVDSFLPWSDFFTLDVADFIGQQAPDDTIAAFVRDMAPFRGALRIPGVDATFEVTDAVLERIGRHYLYAVSEAGRTYRHIASAKGVDHFVTEVSIDEAEAPQRPLELFFILAAIAREKIPAQTIAPKFSGKFLKGVDYVGDVGTFEREFEADLAVIRHSIGVFQLPRSLKISVHTGSDKFSLYPPMRAALKKQGAGIHLKTAGTTWLEEVIGIAISGPAGLALVERIYAEAYDRFSELCRPYATVVEIDYASLPTPTQVAAWSGDSFAQHLRHDPSCPSYSVHFRQLMHVAFKVAAELGDEFRSALDAARETVARCVTANLFDRHIRPLFVGG